MKWKQLSAGGIAVSATSAVGSVWVYGKLNGGNAGKTALVRWQQTASCLSTMQAINETIAGAAVQIRLISPRQPVRLYLRWYTSKQRSPAKRKVSDQPPRRPGGQYTWKISC
jgi:hypothetical protein